MVVLSQSGTYYITPSDSLVRVTNNASVAAILPRQGSRGQKVTVQDVNGGAAINLQDQAGQINVTISNYEALAVSWDDAEQEWFI